ncbi:MAG: PAS domain-containing methyl-accepting chemotaxis protein [Planctomycetes bacterium]|nr:PAS domain-containing methyl-accepting chemotaxis protein [Planctomycetota bacterium]
MSDTFAMIEFEPDGRILDANELFLKVTGYRLEELVGSYHRMFVDREYAASREYEQFWTRLAGGESIAGEFQRVKKGGERFWIEGQYCALRGSNGKVERVVKFAADITARKQAERHAFEALAEIDAVSTTSARIEFDLDGKVLDANAIFLGLMGYRVEEIRGSHHRIFMDPTEASSPQYSKFWADLRAGIPQAGEFRRKSKSGEDVWISGRYSALKGSDGQVFKVVKYANDITPRKKAEQTNAKLRAELVACAEELRVSATELIASADASASSSALTLERAKQVTQNTTVVAGSTEEMSASIQDISNSTHELSESLQRAARAAGDSAQRMEVLRQANEEISRVSETIADIADQTNLLALNATIEAAGAGDAGRGFAVVASEVKDLARETMQATELIKNQVRDVTARSEDVARAVAEINSVIEQVALLSTSLSGAVEEQSVTTREISGAIGGVASGSDEIAGQMEEVARAAATSNHTAQGVLEAAEQLRNLAQALSQES